MATEEKLREYLKKVTVELSEAKRKLAEAENGKQEPIAIVGLACRYPGADSAEEYWDLLSHGRSGISEVPASRWDIDEYYDPDRRSVGGVYTRHGGFVRDVAGWDASFFGVPPQEALRMDPHQRMLMELVWHGLEDAGAAPASLAGSRTAVMVGYMDTVQYGRMETERYGPQVAADPYFGQGVSASVMAGRLAYHYDLRGPAVTIDTACSSSLVGVHLAAQALRRGECDLAVAAGAFLILQPDTYVQACATSMLAPDGRCKTFDSTADGYVMGEGGGVVILERLSTALRNGRRIRAVLRGSAVNQDGRSNGLTAPSRGAQADVIRRALAAALVEPADVAFVEAHGSGTPLGDAIEVSALHDVFGGGRPADRPLHVGAVKTNIGHTQSAAGVAGLIKTVLTLEHGILPGNLHLDQQASAVPADGSVRPVTAPVRLGAGAIAGVSSFGWSGTNAHLVLEAPPAPATAAPSDHARTLTVSAASAQALRAQLDALTARLAAQPDLQLSDVAHTLGTGRAALDFRRAVVSDDREGAIERLAAVAAPARAKSRPTVAFLLPGTGDQYRGLGHELYRDEPVFAEAVDRCVTIVRDRCGVDLAPLFEAGAEPAAGDGGGFAALLGRGRTADEDDPLQQAVTGHPFQFTVEYALAALLRSRDVTPDLLIGYSLGEYVGACLAGVFTLEDALFVVVERARMITAAPAGRMVAVAADEDTVRRLLAGQPSDVDIAALNGPAMTVLSGPPAEIDAVGEHLLQSGVAVQPLRTVHAFHSTLLEPARDKLAALVRTVPRSAPTTTIVSNRTGRPLGAAEATSADYWADHLVQPVRFAQSVRHGVEHGVDVFIELGAGQTLGGLVRQNVSAAEGITVLGTLPPRWTAGGTGRPDARTEIMNACARLWELGVAVDWAAINGPGRTVTLPGYAFQHTRYWPADGPKQAATPAKAAGPRSILYAPAWQRDLSAAAGGTFDGALVVFGDAELPGAVTVARGPAGSAFRRDGGRLVIDPANAEHYKQAIGDVSHVVHAWDGVETLLPLVRALGERGGEARLLTVTRGAVDVLGGDAPAPERAGVHGLARVAEHEIRGLSWSGADLDPATPDAVLLRELARPAAEHGEVAAWRGGRRWASQWAELADAPADPVWRPDGVYLITGGTRGLGMTLAGHLVAAGVRRLALVGRTSLDRATGPKADQARAAIAELAASGADVLALTADTSRPEQLTAALQAARDHFGALHGIVHAAGVPAGGLLAMRNAESVAAVIAPKVAAMGPLAELVGPGTPVDQRPELLVLYSSAVTAFGGIGEGDYCAANTVLDAYGAALAATAPSTAVVSVAWGPWQHDDWQSGAGSTLADRAADYRRRFGFTDAEGLAVLERAVRAAKQGHGRLVAVRQPMEDALAEWSAMLDIDALTGEAVATPAAERFPRPQLRVEFVPPRTEQESTVAAIWQAYLGLQEVGVHDPFFDLGGNSLVGMAMVRAVEKALDTSIAPAVLFEHPTVAEFAAAIGGSGSAAPAPSQDQLAISTDRGQRRRRARPGSRK